MIYIKRLATNFGPLQSAILITINLLVLAGVWDLSKPIVNGINIAIGAWLIVIRQMFIKGLAELDKQQNEAYWEGIERLHEH